MNSHIFRGIARAGFCMGRTSEWNTLIFSSYKSLSWHYSSKEHITWQVENLAMLLIIPFMIVFQKLIVQASMRIITFTTTIGSHLFVVACHQKASVYKTSSIWKVVLKVMLKELNGLWENYQTKEKKLVFLSNQSQFYYKIS